MPAQPTTVGDLMQSPVVTVERDATVGLAGKRMTESGVGAVVVLGDDSAVAGILTERDLLRLIASDEPAERATVAAWMTADPVTATPSTTAADAVRTLSEHRFRHLPIVADGDLVGIVSIRDLMAAARIEPVLHPGELEAPKGLAGVVVAETEVGDVRGREGFFHYREYSAVDLAEGRTLEDVWHLMLLRELPASVADRDTFRKRVAPLREVPEHTAAQLPQIAAASDGPLDGLRTAASLVAAEERFRPVLDADADELLENSLRITAVVPTLIAALYRLGNGDEPVPPEPDLPYAANYLAMIHGEAPDPEHARAIEQYLISTIDHGFNASTFTARVITSTGADLGAAVVGAMGALSGPLHGGAPSRALDLLDEIGDVSRADEVVRRKIENGERIMGFGHRVYKTRDPRSRLLRDVALRLGGSLAELAAEVEDVVVDVLEELKPGRELYANVEYYAGIVLQKVGITPPLFTPTFTASRTIGWCAHVLEQAADNRIIRPTAHYVGPRPPQPVPSLDG